MDVSFCLREIELFLRIFKAILELLDDQTILVTGGLASSLLK